MYFKRDFKFVNNICLGEVNSAMVSTRRVKRRRDFLVFPSSALVYFNIRTCILCNKGKKSLTVYFDVDTVHGTL